MTRLKFSLSLLTERRGMLFVVLDGLFVIVGLIVSLGNGTSAAAFYPPMFLMPALLIAIPMLADSVAIERRSGTLDLAMTSPGAHSYFERRVGAVAALLIAQGCFGLFIARVFGEPFPVIVPLVQIIVIALFIAAAALNWSVRVRTTGAVVFAMYATVIAFSPWFFSNPVHPPTLAGLGPMTTGDYIAWAKANIILAMAAAIFYLYARQRLSRPETIIT